MGNVSIPWTILTMVVFPLTVVVVGYLLKKAIDKSFKGWEKYNQLKEDNLEKWKGSLESKVCTIKETVEGIKESVTTFVEDKELREVMTDVTAIKIRVNTLEEKVKHSEKYEEENKSNIKELFNRCNVCDRRKRGRINE